MALLAKPFNGTPLRDVKLDAVKGILILCIILEHNSLLTFQYSWIRPFSDAFAAGAFLILSFRRPLKIMPVTSFLNKYFSYWVPFTIFTLFLAILNFIFFDSDNFFLKLLKAIFFASPQEIKESTGFMYIWFLPCLTVLYLLRFIEQKIRVVILVLAVFSFLFIGELKDNILVATPYSLHVIAFIYILGVIYRHIHNPLVESSAPVRLVSAVFFVVLCFISGNVGWNLFLAGGIIPSWREPFLLIYYGVMLTISIPCIYNLLSFIPGKIVRLFAELGKSSLLLYLLHPIVFFLLFRFFILDVNPWVSFIITIFISMLLALLVKKIPVINHLVFPSHISMIFCVKEVKY